MRRFAYISRARGDLTPNDIKDIVDKSIANNFLQAVSGVMIFDGKGFFQVIEGESLTIASLVQRIRRDTRHHAIEVVLDKPVEQVSYPSWGMKIVQGPRVEGAFHSATAQDFAEILALSDPEVLNLLVKYGS